MGIAGLKRIERMNYILGGILIAAAAMLASTQEQALGVVVGVVLSAINFSVMRRMVEKWVAAASPEKGNAGAPATFFMIPKMALLMVAIFLALWFLPISAGGLAIGFSVFLVSIAIETARLLTNPPAPGPGNDDPTSTSSEDES